jgi:hypothetical protein
MRKIRTFDYGDLLARYCHLVASRNRGDTMLDSYSGFAPDEIAEIRRIAGAGRNPMAAIPQKTGGNAPGDRPARGWFAHLLDDDREAEAAARLDGDQS